MSERKLLEQLEVVKVYEDRLEHLRDGYEKSDAFGASLEFGVYKANTLNFLARSFPNDKFWGFDSFDGLPEPWIRSEKKHGVTPHKWFALENTPSVEENVELVVGLFDETLPRWLEANSGPISFLHVDCDLYNSTSTVLELLDARIIPGTVIVFDELLDWPEGGYDCWKEGEWRALCEWLLKYDREIELIATTQTGQATALVKC